MSFGINSGGTSDRLSFFDDKNNLQHKQENPTEGYNKCKNCPRKGNKKRNGIMTWLFKKGRV